MKLSHSRQFLLLAALALSACGGGGSGSNPPPPPAPQPSTNQLFNADRAELRAVVNLTGSTLSVFWIDFSGGATSYTVQQQLNGAAAWSDLATVAANGSGNGQELSWSGPVGAITAVRARVNYPGLTVPLGTLTRATSAAIAISVPAPAPTIVIDHVEPIANSVVASIQNAGSYVTVRYVRNDEQSVHAIVHTAPYKVHVEPTPPAPLTLHAALVTNTDLSYEIQRTMTSVVPAAQIRVQPNNGLVSRIDVTPISGFGIVDVSLDIDGTHIGTLSASNIGGGVYRFDASGFGFTSATRVATATVRTSDGSTSDATALVVFNNLAVVNLTSPIDGAIVNGTLTVAGTAVSDKGGAVEISGNIGGTVNVPATGASPFNIDVNVAALTPGTYTLTLLARDVDGSSRQLTRTVTVASTTALAYTPVASLGADGGLLATSSGANVLTRDSSGAVTLRLGTSAVSLDTAAISNLQHWQLDGDQTYALGSPAASSTIHLYHWSADGTRDDVGLFVNSQAELPRLRAVHNPWVLATSESGGANVLHLVNAQTTAHLTPNLGIFVLGEADFHLDGGVPLVFYTVTSGGITGINSWNQGTNLITPIANEAVKVQRNPRTDGTLLAWQSTAGGPARPFTLNARVLATSNDTALSTTADNYRLAPGTLAWLEGVGGNSAIKAYDGAATVTLSPRVDVELAAAGTGYTVFYEDGKLFAATNAGVRTLIFEARATTVLMSAKTVYFTNGAGLALYAVTLP